MGNIRKTLNRRLAGLTAAFVATLGLLLMPLSPLVTSVAADPPAPKPWDITTGPDGALWFTELDGNKIGRITTGGVVTEYTVPTADAKPYGIAAGPDGALWFTENNVSKIGRITTTGTITEYDLPRNTNNDQVMPTDIVAGSNNDLWYTAVGSVGRITTAGVATRTELPSQYSTVGAKGITNYFGMIWFTIPATNTASAVGRILNGSLTTFPLLRGIVPTDITAGPSDSVWMTSISTTTSSSQLASSLVWRVVEDGGYYAPYNIPTESYPSNIGRATGNNLWYNGRDNNTVVHFLPNGDDVTHQLSIGSCPQGLTEGPDSAMWFTEACSNKIGRIGPDGALTEYSLVSTPAAPTNLNATSPTTQPHLSWTASAGAASYNVYRNGNLVGNTAGTTYDDNGLTSGTYSYYVKAVGSNNQESDASNTINVIVATAPLVTITDPTEDSTVSGTVDIDATIYSASNYSRMLYVRNSSNQAVVSQYQFSVPNSTTTFGYSWDTTTVPNGTYTIILTARDSLGNKDDNSTSTVHVTVQN